MPRGDARHRVGGIQTGAQIRRERGSIASEVVGPEVPDTFLVEPARKQAVFDAAVGEYARFVRAAPLEQGRVGADNRE